MDKLTPEQRKKCMKASSKNKGTKPELLLAKYLWALGLRYRKNDRSIFGTPDLSFKRYKIAILLMVSFGMERIGIFESMISKVTKIFGFQKLSII